MQSDTLSQLTIHKTLKHAMTLKPIH